MSEFWTFLEETRLPDHCLADGYEQTGPQLRGWLKKNIAVRHELLEQRLPPKFQRKEISYGASLCAHAATPAPWCLIVHDAAYPAAPRALAAALPAQLAGVPVIWSVALHEGSAAVSPPAPPAPVLAAWELAGVENVASASREVFMARLREFASGPACAGEHGPGRVLILGAPDWGGEIRAIFDNERVSLLRQEGPLPRILLTGDEAEAYYPTICALHPDAGLHMAGQGRELAPDAAYAAVFSPDAANSENIRAALRLDYEHCGCWFWPELDADFFLNHELSLFSTL